MTAPDKAMRTVYAGTDVWIMRYPAVSPVLARILSVTGNTAVAAAYNPDGTLDTANKRVLKFPPPDGRTFCSAFHDEKSAVEAWNAAAMQGIADLTEQYKENVKMLEARILRVPGEEDGTHGG